MIPNLWHPETVYLNTASFGLPPDPAWEALQKAQEDWRAGRVSWEHWTAVTDRTRAQFATLVGARPEQVVVGANVSGLISQIAVAIPDGSRVLAPEPEFVVAAVPVPGPGRARRDGRRRAAGPARLRRRRVGRCRRGVGRAVVDR